MRSNIDRVPEKRKKPLRLFGVIIFGALGLYFLFDSGYALTSMVWLLNFGQKTNASIHLVSSYRRNASYSLEYTVNGTKQTGQYSTGFLELYYENKSSVPIIVGSANPTKFYINDLREWIGTILEFLFGVFLLTAAIFGNSHKSKSNTRHE